ncbi:MAG: deoxyuridine 5'-triphosphate nucleotidohydrolase [Candidatus Micrarchaeia archaeon]
MVLNKDELAERILKDKLVDLTDAKHQLQPASVDLTLEKVFSFEGQGALDFDNSERVLSEVKEIPFKNDWVELARGAYKVRFVETVRLPPDVASVTFTRSSLARCGCELYTGWWDPGYAGRGESLLMVHNPAGIRLKRGAKIAQMVFLPLNASKHLYAGVHHGEHL